MKNFDIPSMPDYSYASKLANTMLGMVTTLSNSSKEEIYNEMHKALYEATYGKHYDETFAKDEVFKLVYRDCDGEEHQGEHWPLEKVKELTSKYEFGENVTDWDKYVAFNYIYSKLCCSFSFEQIIAIGYLLFFAEEDNDCKIWDYLRTNK